MSILSHNKATLTDQRGRHDITVEINKTGEGQQAVEMSVRDKNDNKISSYITLKELYSLIFTLMGPEEQSEMMPVRRTQMTTFKRKHVVMTTKNMKKGEKIIVNCEINVPTVIEEGLAGIMGKRKISKSDILVPLK